MARYLSGEHVLDIGYRGGDPNSVPVTEKAIGVELDFPGYDGTRLPFDACTQDAVLASHVLEHVPDYRRVLADWYRVLRVGGYLVLFVPHQHLFEKRPDIPSRWVGDHCRFYTPASLLRELEEALPVNGYRVRHLTENDEGYNYGDTADMPPRGSFEIELVAEKIVRPAYSEALVYPQTVKQMIAGLDRLIIEVVAEALKGRPAIELFAAIIGGSRYFTPWQRLREHFLFASAPEIHDQRVTEAELKRVVRPLLDLVDVDPASYSPLYDDLRSHSDPAAHWRLHGYFEGRATRDLSRLTRDVSKTASNRKANTAQVLTCYGTVLFVDVTSGELRHGDRLSSPANVRLIQGQGSHQLLHLAADGTQLALHVPPFAAPTAPAEDHLPTSFEVIDIGVHCGGFGLASSGLFLCADTAGRVTLSRKQLGTWETFKLIDGEPARPRAESV